MINRTIFFTVLLSMMISCQDDEVCCTNIVTLVTLPIGPEIDPDGITIYYANEEGEHIEVLENDRGYPNGYKYIAENSTVGIFANTDYIDSDNISYTYVDWGNGELDELKAEFHITDNSTVITRVWLNGVLMQDY